MSSLVRATVIFVVSLMTTVCFAVDAKQIKIDGFYLPKSQLIKDFHLTDNHGKSFDKNNLLGHWTLMFFGFTNCGMICPSTMSALNGMYQQLEKQLPAQQLPQVVMVSVDPERDTVTRMNSYINAFNKHFIGVRGDSSETIALQKQLHIVAEKMQVEGQGKDHYTINHTAEIMVINPKGELQAYFSYPHEAEQMVRDFKLISQ